MIAGCLIRNVAILTRHMNNRSKHAAFLAAERILHGAECQPLNDQRQCSVFLCEDPLFNFENIVQTEFP